MLPCLSNTLWLQREINWRSYIRLLDLRKEKKKTHIKQIDSGLSLYSHFLCWVRTIIRKWVSSGHVGLLRMAPSKLQQLGGFHWRFAGSVQADVRRGELKIAPLSKHSPNFQGQNWKRAKAFSPTRWIFLFVNRREKGVSHEARRDALWMITPNWSVKVNYACLDLTARSQLGSERCVSREIILLDKHIVTSFFFFVVKDIYKFCANAGYLASWLTGVFGKLGAHLLVTKQYFSARH